MTATSALVDTTLADFTRSNGTDAIARISVRAIPEPTGLALATILIGIVAAATRRRGSLI